MRFVASNFHHVRSSLPERSEDGGSGARGRGECYLASLHSRNARPLWSDRRQDGDKSACGGFPNGGQHFMATGMAERRHSRGAELGFPRLRLFAILTGRLSPSAIASGQGLMTGPFWFLMALPFLWFVAEVLTMLTNEKRRALHDFIAKTVVIRTNTQEESAQSAPPNAGSTDAPPASVS